MSEPLPHEMADALRRAAGRLGSLGNSVHYYTEVTSTNDVAATLAEHRAREGTIVIASSQSAGRGRLGRNWHSPAGAGLYVSIVFRNPRVAPKLTLAGGVAVAEGIRAATALPVEIKWPNDVVLSDERSRQRRLKLAGVLAEASSGADGLQYVILGFGINVRLSPFPGALGGIATCIERELGRPVDATAILVETLTSLSSLVERLERGDEASVLSRWRVLAPSALGSTVEWQRADTRARGTTIGIDDEGALLVRMGDSTERIVAGEVQWL
jgi:BirA family transcriptional regulator, biotin operon repressor / biotin---[acetyl-CoA-carboxylase] ligase